MQKLKMSFFHLLESLFTCFLKDKTLHNHWDYAGFTVPYYNIPSNNRELQREAEVRKHGEDYNIPSNNRELQPERSEKAAFPDYNIPSNNRELQQNCISILLKAIITYQVITGNYSLEYFPLYLCTIITYQVITGNYSTF